MLTIYFLKYFPFSDYKNAIYLSSQDDKRNKEGNIPQWNSKARDYESKTEYGKPDRNVCLRVIIFKGRKIIETLAACSITS